MQPLEKEAFERAAELSGQSVSEWMRLRLRDAAERELKERNQDVPFLSGHKTALDRDSEGA